MSVCLKSISTQRQVFINEILKQLGIVEVETLIANQVVKPGDNCFGQILEINVVGKKVQNTVDKISIIAKLAPSVQTDEEYFVIRSIYKREIYMYDVVLPELVIFQKNHKIKNMFAPFAQCYATSGDDGQEIILLENMNNNGYRSVSRQIPVDYKHASLMIKSCAKLHAISFAFRDQKPDLFEELSAYTKKSTGVPEMFLPIVVNIATKMLNNIEKTSEVYEALHSFIKDPHYVLELFQSESAGEHAVITHGDYQNKNILFRYKDKSNPTIPSDLCILDWQLSIFASPCLDISSFVWACTDKKLRNEHYFELIDLYYDTFCKFLCELGGDPEKLYPRTVFENQLKKFSVTGLIAAIFNIADFSNDTGDTLSIETFDEIANVSCFSRICENFEDFLKYGYSLRSM
ncbi:hypothetical protein FQR65_LT11524 [Abscondita terminalis]|nr:hypothetical protein FQR65_LT11524 [Abscondita terminalis]